MKRAKPCGAGEDLYRMASKREPVTRGSLNASGVDAVNGARAEIDSTTRGERDGAALIAAAITASPLDEPSHRHPPALKRLQWARGAALLSLLLALGVLVACQASSRQRPVKGGPTDAGPGSMEYERRQLEGTWDLQAFYVTGANGSKTQVPATGRLTYDAFGNLALSGKIEGQIPNASPTGTAQILDYTGRVVIDPARHEMRLMSPQTEKPVDPATVAIIGPSLVRRYAIEGGQLTLTFLDDKQASTAVAEFRRAANP